MMDWNENSSFSIAWKAACARRVHRESKKIYRAQVRHRRLLGDVRPAFGRVGKSGQEGRALTCDLRADRADGRQRSVLGLRRRVPSIIVKRKSDVGGSQVFEIRHASERETSW